MQAPSKPSFCKKAWQGQGEAVVTTRRQTASFCTSMGLVHGHTGLFMDSGGVQDTVHFPSPLSRRPVPFRLPDNQNLRSYLLKESAALCEKGAIARVPRSQLHHAAFYASMFLVPKPNGAYRLILNISKLNVHIPCPHFKMETVQSVRAAVRP